VKLYLFDLDKVRLLARAPRWVKRLRRRRDVRRLLDSAREVATPQEVAVVEATLGAGDAAAPQAS
jgi:hypothetical protein